MTTFAKAPAPHIRASESVPKIIWKMSVGLLPVLIASFVLFQGRAVALVLVTVTAAVLAEILACRVRKRPHRLKDGSTVFFGLMLAMLLPSELPLWMAALGGFLAVLMGKELFGGLGASPFHPSLIGHGFLLLGFPVAMQAQAAATPLVMMKTHLALESQAQFGLFFGNYPGAIGATCVPAIFLGGLYLVWQKVIRWEIPFLFLGSLFALAPLLDYDPWASLLAGSGALAAFFIVPDPMTTPLTRQGGQVSAIGAAVLVMVLRRWSPYPEGLTFAVLIMNALAPWIDQWMRPRGSYLP